MKILVTGATGLVGTNLIKRLEGHKVLRMSRKLGYDLRDKELTKIAIEDFKPDIVYHLAANAAESRGQVSPQDMTERNLNIFLNVLVPSINVKVKRFIYTSSIAIYGDCEIPYAEDDIPKPKDIYGINKLAAEQMLKVLSKIHGLDYTIFRFHNLYGPHQDMTNPYRNIVALAMRNAMENKPITLFGEGKMKRAFSYIDDIIDVLVASLDEKFKNQTVNVGSALDVEVIDMVKLVEKISGKKLDISFLPARPQEIFNFLPSHRKLHLLYPYNETPLKEGLERTWESLNLPDILQEENEIYTR